MKKNLTILILLLLFSFLKNTLAQYSIQEIISTSTNLNYPSNLFEWNGKMYFSASDNSNRYELWAFDGINTNQITNINPTNGSSPEGFVIFNSKLYFAAEEDTYGRELYVYDGINPPTLVADIWSGISNSDPKYLQVYNGKLYFSAQDGTNGVELWEYDGNNPPTMVTNIHPYGDAQPSYLKSFGGKLYFSCTDGTNGYELWEYDGVNASLFADIHPTGDSYPSELTSYNGKLVFQADNGTDGKELWEYDGINPPMIISDIHPSWGSNPTGLTEFNGKLFFNANDGTHGYELWEYDGTNTTLIYDINPSGHSSPGEFTVYSNQLFFGCQGDNNDNELWSYDGVNPPARVADIIPGTILESRPTQLFAFNDRLYMQAQINFGFEVNRVLAEYMPIGIPTLAGTYTAVRTSTEDNWTHYIDANDSLLLSLEIGSSGAVVGANQVQLMIGNTTTTSFNQYCDETPECFIDLPSGAVVFNRNWEVTPTTQPTSGNHVGVKFYFTQKEFDAVNTAIGGAGITMEEMWFYKVTNGEIFPALPSLEASEVLVLTNDGATPSVPSASNWVLGNNDSSNEFFAEYEVTSFSGGGGGGAEAGGHPLPVDMISFHGKLMENQVALNWTTASERSNAYFNVEKSTDGLAWEAIGQVIGQGNSTQRSDYEFMDSNPHGGVNYYRLQQVDFAGKSDYSPVVSIDLEIENMDVLIYPNPTQKWITIKNAVGEANIYNSFGQIVQKIQLESAYHQLDVSELKAGTYYIHFKSNPRMVSKRFFKMED